MNLEKSIQIFHITNYNHSRLNESIFQKLALFYKIEIKAIAFDNVKQISKEDKAHMLIFDNVKPEEINYAEIDPIIQKNPGIHLLLVYKALSKQRQTLCYEKHIDYIINGSFDDKYISTYLKNILRRRSSKYFANEIYINFKNLKLDNLMGEIYIDNVLIETTKKEFKIIRELLNNKEGFISKKELFNKVWKYEEDSSRILDQYIHRLRKKIGSQITIISDRKNGFRIF